MSTQQLEQQTYLPDESGAVADVLSFISKHESARGTSPTPQYFLSGPGEHEYVQIPTAAYQVLLQVLRAMESRKAVTVVPQSTTMTTQQAADLLGISRPTVVKLIDTGELPAETPGKRRRLVKLDDVLAYRVRRRQAQYKALLATSTDYDEDLAPPEVRESRLREVRAEAAADRRAQRVSTPQ